MFYVKFTRNVCAIGPDSKEFGPYEKVEMLADDEDEFSPVLTCVEPDGTVSNLAYRDYGAWYCDYDGDVYRSFEIIHKD